MQHLHKSKTTFWSISTELPYAEPGYCEDL